MLTNAAASLWVAGPFLNLADQRSTFLWVAGPLLWRADQRSTLLLELSYEALRSTKPSVLRSPPFYEALRSSFFFLFLFSFLVSPQPSRPWLRRTGGRHCFTQQVNVLRHLSVLQHLCYVRADSIRNRVRCFLLLLFLFLFHFFFRTVGGHRRRNLCSHR